MLPSQVFIDNLTNALLCTNISIRMKPFSVQSKRKVKQAWKRLLSIIPFMLNRVTWSAEE